MLWIYACTLKRVDQLRWESLSNVTDMMDMPLLMEKSKRDFEGVFIGSWLVVDEVSSSLEIEKVLTIEMETGATAMRDFGLK